MSLVVFNLFHSVLITFQELDVVHCPFKNGALVLTIVPEEVRHQTVRESHYTTVHVSETHTHNHEKDMATAMFIANPTTTADTESLEQSVVNRQVVYTCNIL